MPRLMYVKTPAPDREPRLTAMIAEIEKQATSSYRPFSSARELGRLVRDDLALLLSERFANANAVGSASATPSLNRRVEHSLPVTSTSLIGRERDVAEELATEHGLAVRPLDRWTARRSDGYGMAPIEMSATVADVLTFYQERYANRAWLRTAGAPRGGAPGWGKGAFWRRRPAPGLARL